MDPAAIESLTEREKQVLRLVARDRSSGEIAAILDLSTNTVENHIKNARRRLNDVSRFAAARLLAEHEGRDQSLASRPLALPRLEDSLQPTDLNEGSRPVWIGLEEPLSKLPPNSTAVEEIAHASSALTVILKIVAIAVLLAMIAIMAPTLKDNAGLVANRMFE